MGVNVFLGLQGLMKAMVGELSLRPDLVSALRAEVAESVGDKLGQGLDTGVVSRLPLLDKVLKEVLRLHPPVFFIFGRANYDFVIQARTGQYRIAKGDLLMGVIPVAQQDPTVFHDPEQFDPSRFDDPAASQFLIWPHGQHTGPISAHNRICPGRDYAVLVAKLFCTALVGRHDWSLADPDVRWSQARVSLNVASPIGSIDVASFRRC